MRRPTSFPSTCLHWLPKPAVSDIPHKFQLKNIYLSLSTLCREVTTATRTTLALSPTMSNLQLKPCNVNDRANFLSSPKVIVCENELKLDFSTILVLFRTTPAKKIFTTFWNQNQNWPVSCTVNSTISINLECDQMQREHLKFLPICCWTQHPLSL